MLPAEVAASSSRDDVDATQGAGLLYAWLKEDALS